MVSRAARSLWIDLLGLMHESVRYGYLLIAGMKPSSAQIASVLGDKERDVQRWIEELEQVSVFSRTDEGVIYSRRMVRDKAKQEMDRENGRGGGNPRLKPDVDDGVNPPDKAQKPEARAQKLEAREPKEEVRANARRASKGTRWPSEAIVPADWIAKAELSRAAHGLEAIDMAYEAGRFQNYWAAKAGQNATRIDWEKTWLNWATDKEKTGGKSKQSGRGIRDGAEHALATIRRDAGEDAATAPNGSASRASRALPSPSTASQSRAESDPGTDHPSTDRPRRDISKLSHDDRGTEPEIPDVLHGPGRANGTAIAQGLQTVSDRSSEQVLSDAGHVAGVHMRGR